MSIRKFAETDKMNRFNFRCFILERFGMTDDLMMDRMFTYFDGGRSGPDGVITREQTYHKR